MSRSMILTDLRPGQKAVVTGFRSANDMRSRLQDMGLIEGTEVRCIGRSPLGDPTAYGIRRAVIALRSEDSGMVTVKLIQGEDVLWKNACD